jgi:hypothetical protein
MNTSIRKKAVNRSIVMKNNVMMIVLVKVSRMGTPQLMMLSNALALDARKKVAQF